MATLSERVALLATGIANYIRDSIKPRLIPSGGSANQVLRKTSGTDYATEWSTNKTVQYPIQLGNNGIQCLIPIKVTISDADVTPKSIIDAWYSPVRDVANEEYEDDAEFDYLDVRVLPSSVAAGSFKVAISTRDPKSRINNQKTIIYRVQN